MPRAACEAVHKYVPTSTLPWHDIDVTMEMPLELSCAGEFHDPVLNVEQRRFLFRDVIPFGVFVVNCVGYGVVGLASILIGSAPGGAFLIQYAMVFAVGLVASITGGYAHFSASQLDSRTTVALIAAMLAYCGLGAGTQVLFAPSQRVLACGDTDMIETHVNASDVSAAANATRAAIANAIANRQKYCIDAIDRWFLGGIVAAVVIFRMLPVHATVTGVFTFCLVPVGLALRDYVIARDEEYDTEPISVATTMLVFAGCLGISIVRNVRQSAVDRERFLAAVGAERARRRAMAELRQVDSLLRRALPETVLQRVSEGITVADESENVTVVLVAIRCHFEAATSAVELTGRVALLQRTVSKFDELIASEDTAASMAKVKTLGDTYWAMSGLPDPVSCHASAACRFAMRAHGVAALSLLADDSDVALPSPRSGANTNTTPVRLRVGVHSGHAAAAVLGLNCLSYEPLGEACDGCQTALQHCPPDVVCVTDAVKRRLAMEAQNQALVDGDRALFGSPCSVHDALDAITTDGARTYYVLAESHRGPFGGLRTLENITVRSHVVDTTSTFTSTGFDAAALQSRQAQLECRLKYLLHRADEAKARTTRARPFDSKARYAVTRKPHAEVTAFADEAEADHTPNRHATEMVAELEDPVHGPFAPATCVPLVYTFRDEEEEQGFLDYARRVTYTLRRDVRTATAAFLWMCGVWYAATGDRVVGMCLFFLAACVGTANAAIMWLRRWDRADPVLACVSMAVFIGALWAADNHTLGNDPDWGSLVVFLSVLLTEWTLSPLVRLVVMLALDGVSSSKMIVIGQSSTASVAPGFVTIGFGIAVFVVVAEKYSRRSYIERRLAEALLAQQQISLQAQKELLRSVVPPDLAPRVHAWIVGGCEPSAAVVEHLGSCAVAVLKMCRATGGGTAEEEMTRGRLEWLLGQHTAVDAMMERCCVARKIKTEGDTILLLGRASADHESVVDGGAAAAAPDAADSLRAEPASDIGRGALGAFVAEIACLAQVFAWTDVKLVAGIDVGPVVGAVLGSERLSYDVIGDAVQAAQQTMLAATPPLRALRDISRVAVTAAGRADDETTAVAGADDATTSSSLSDAQRPVIALSAGVIGILDVSTEHHPASDIAFASDHDIWISLPGFGVLRSSEGGSSDGRFEAQSVSADGGVDSGRSSDLSVRAAVTAMSAGPGGAVLRVLRG